jgi:gliding motility-associated-like protein
VLKVEIMLGDGDISWLADGVVIPDAMLDSVTVTPQGIAVNYVAVLTDATGCTASAGPVTVLVKKCFDIPNAFTPNGDSSNDTFGPVLYGATADILEFNVYSRWGQKIFTATDSKKEWDGRVDGKDAPSDVYVYQMKVRFLNGDEEERTGQVTLIR